ncbi:MAG: peroxiredoxin family protein [Solirubrobacteraceae bacterium]
MSSSTGEQEKLTKKQRLERARAQRKAREATEQVAAVRRKVLIRVGAALAVAVVVLAAIFLHGTSGGSAHATSGASGRYPYVVGQPGPGATAPPIELPSTAGGQFNLAAQRGHTVLLYFQEGLDCQPCWTQLVDIQKNMAAFHAAGIEQIVSITTDPLGDLQQKVADEGIKIPVLSDQGLAVSREYSANNERYTMMGAMGSTRDGHTFIVVGPEGKIRWRADYGGEPNYTMYLPSSNLLTDLRRGMAAHA